MAKCSPEKLRNHEDEQEGVFRYMVVGIVYRQTVELMPSVQVSIHAMLASKSI